MASRTLDLDEALYAYLQRVSLREPPLLRRLRDETNVLAHDRARMQVSPEQGQLMALLVRLVGASRTLEIGVFTGYSTLAVGLALPADGCIVACDISKEWTDVARRYWEEAGVARKIELRLGPALSTLDDLLAAGGAGTFDFAFIDADKKSYQTYYERALALIRPGGLIAIDNVLWSGKVADLTVQDEDTRALRALNEKLHTDERVDLSLIPIGDGLTLARKRHPVA
ncbi:MAG: SAM-dependent methyltransferase [Luteitalea sp.]|nr:SAM-dependent methyltransferase [Luteitalea sp.]